MIQRSWRPVDADLVADRRNDDQRSTWAAERRSRRRTRRRWRRCEHRSGTIGVDPAVERIPFQRNHFHVAFSGWDGVPRVAGVHVPADHRKRQRLTRAPVVRRRTERLSLGRARGDEEGGCCGGGRRHQSSDIHAVFLRRPTSSRVGMHRVHGVVAATDPTIVFPNSPHCGGNAQAGSANGAGLENFADRFLRRVIRCRLGERRAVCDERFGYRSGGGAGGLLRGGGRSPDALCGGVGGS